VAQVAQDQETFGVLVVLVVPRQSSQSTTQSFLFLLVAVAAVVRGTAKLAVAVRQLLWRTLRIALMVQAALMVAVVAVVLVVLVSLVAKLDCRAPVAEVVEPVFADWVALQGLLRQLSER
jgi:hypothetical protein